MRIPCFPSDALGDEKSIELIEMLLRHCTAPYSRHTYTPGHLTATGLVLHPNGRSMAMVFHRRLQRWLLPGGHVEAGDADVEAAAAREVLEETGLEVGNGRIIGADVHGIPAKWKNGLEVEPYHLHHDVLVGFVTQQTELTLSDESLEVRWVALEEFDQYAVPSNVRRGYRRVQG